MYQMRVYQDIQKTEGENVQKQHQELLKYFRDNNDNREVAFVFKDNILEERKEFLGSDAEINKAVSTFLNNKEMIEWIKSQ